MESLSAYARQFLERMEKPDVDRIDGISPAIAIRQKNSIRNPRSTVGTTTEIHDYMRLLFARVGRTYCRQCGREVLRDTAEVVARQLAGLPESTRLLIGFDLLILEGQVGSGNQDGQVGQAGQARTAGESIEPVDEDAEDIADVPAAPGAHAAAVATAIEGLRRKGFGRLLVGDDGAAVETRRRRCTVSLTRPLRVIVDLRAA